MSDILEMFEEFLEDDNAMEMYISGMAGTGKTTSMRELVEHCVAADIKCGVCAYTHKAVEVLRDKLPKADRFLLSTLHSYLKKQPTLDSGALKVSHVEGNSQMGSPDSFDVIFIDEYSMVGESDYNDIKELQQDRLFVDEKGDRDIRPGVKFVYLGDKNQLPPVKDDQVIYPKGKYQILLTKIYRQAGDSELIDTLVQLNGFLNGDKPTPLKPHKNFIRGKDIVEEYKNFDRSKCLLAYTNATVEQLNYQVQGYALPKEGDAIFSPGLRKNFTFIEQIEKANAIHGRKEILELNSKYKTLETLHTMQGVKFYSVLEKDIPRTYAVVFGHDTYLKYSKALAADAVKTNRVIENSTGMNAKDWSQSNWKDPMAIDRKEAWKKLMSFKEWVFCMDFAHAMTVHKSQGSTFERVYLDMEDLALCANRDYNMYLRLLYVAISRASDMAITN